MKPIDTSTFTFWKLIRHDYLYVDKTAFLYELVRRPFGQYFLARPRRFGKSLLVSTLKSIFLGERDLFEGLAIAEMDYDWERYPVIHIDLGSRQASSAEDLGRRLSEAVDDAAADYEIRLSRDGCAVRFEELVHRLAEQGKVVILIDEYDKPILGNAEDLAEVKRIKQTLKAFYSVIKTTEPVQRFAFLTGVSKFSKVSVFSDLNNLTDLTMDERFATALGYTQEELELYFADRIERLADKQGLPREALLSKISQWYNGYRFTEHTPSVYNPVSVMNCLDQGKFRSYWFETGTPSFLIDLIKKREYDLAGIETESVLETAFSTYEIENLEILPLLVQTGYLTIRDFQQRGNRRLFSLGYPNYEVKEAFNTWLAASYSGLERGMVESRLFRLIDALEGQDLDRFFSDLRVFFANIPNTIHMRHEKYYQSIFYVIFSMIGLEIEAEVDTNIGRIDAVAATSDHVYLFEFKLHDTAESAMAQIREMRYYEKYLDRGKPVTLVGAAFDPNTRNVERWLSEPV